MKADTAAIIVAGGKGLRFGGNVRKQFLSLQGHPLLWWSVRAFIMSPSIAEIVVVVPKDDLSLLTSSPEGGGRGSKEAFPWVPRQRPRGMTIYCVAGGAARSDSVRHGLQQVSPSVRYVAVHDAVRPLVRPADIEAVIASARKSKAALAACPSKDTVKIANTRAQVISSPPRERVWLAQTPQVFERTLLQKAHEKGRQHVVTDDAQLVERLGVKVTLVDTSPENIKVTVPMDFAVAQLILKGRT